MFRSGRVQRMLTWMWSASACERIQPLRRNPFISIASEDPEKCSETPTEFEPKASTLSSIHFSFTPLPQLHSTSVTLPI